MKRQNATGSVFRIVDSRDGAERWIAQVSIGKRGERRYRKRVRRTYDEAVSALAEIGGARRATEEERFWRYVAKGSDCWLWTGARTSRGYGLFTRDGRRRVPAYRYSLELSLGITLASDVYALHQCDNPPCVRPDHLRPGSQAENMAEWRDRRS